MDAAGWLALAFVCAGAFGCGGVQRRITIRSNPPGAQVYIDKYEIGRTPCSVGFIYYGKREFKLIKDGFETLTTTKMIFPPWYEFIGIDLISENFSPFEIRDERTYDFQLIPMQVVGPQQLIGRGENLRQATRAEGLAIPPPTSPGVTQPRNFGPMPSGSYPPPPGSFPLPPPSPQSGFAPPQPGLLPPRNRYPLPVPQ
ncbi:MAG TPA: PEGA domain-containing protein [Pirellulales bacterium]|nr:PEGA domain-containing protein [Pirellulales bacterium]